MFVADVQACIDESSMVPHGAHVVVAVSGGADSVALLAALVQLRSRYGMTLTVVHVNHHRREGRATVEHPIRLHPCNPLSLS